MALERGIPEASARATAQSLHGDSLPLRPIRFRPGAGAIRESRIERLAWFTVQNSRLVLVISLSDAQTGHGDRENEGQRPEFTQRRSRLQNHRRDGAADGPRDRRLASPQSVDGRCTSAIGRITGDNIVIGRLILGAPSGKFIGGEATNHARPARPRRATAPAAGRSENIPRRKSATAAANSRSEREVKSAR